MPLNERNKLIEEIISKLKELKELLDGKTSLDDKAPSNQPPPKDNTDIWRG